MTPAASMKRFSKRGARAPHAAADDGAPTVAFLHRQTAGRP
jgi:hypothetical protein